MHFGYFRMSFFDDLVTRIWNYFAHTGTQNILVDVSERLVVTLRILASGGLSVSVRYRLGSTKVPLIVSEVCPAIWQVLQSPFVCFPSRAGWSNIAK